MKNKLTVLFINAVLSFGTMAGGMEDDPLIGKVMIDQFEVRSTGGANPVVLEAEAWLGRDLHKLWFKTEVEKVGSLTEEAEVQLLYARAIDPYWDLQFGWRHDVRPRPNRDWLVIAVEGLAPYWIELGASAFIGENGQVAARLEAEYEWMLTQQWVLSPEFEINAYSKDDDAVEIGSGLSDMELGLRLRYEVVREFAPYLGINWSRKFGGTADHARDEGEEVSDIQFVVGIRAWF